MNERIPERDRRRSVSGSRQKSDTAAIPGRRDGLGGRDGSGGGKPRRGLGLKAAAAVALVAAAVSGFALFADGTGADAVTAAELQSRDAAYQTLIAGSGMALDMVAFDEVDAAVDAMPVEPEVRERVRQDVAEGRVSLAWITLWDTHAEDGDVLEFSASGVVPVQVTALNARTTLAIPYPADGVVTVKGVRDGGGGITIALQSGAAEIAWPTMQEGQALRLPVTPGF